MTRQFTVKQVVHAAFASRKRRTHQQIADVCLRLIPTARTSARSVASMYMDWKRLDPTKVTQARAGGRVKELVYAMFEQGGLTANEIALKVREAIPEAHTTHKSVASMKVDWKRAGGGQRQIVEMTAEHLGL